LRYRPLCDTIHLGVIGSMKMIRFKLKGDRALYIIEPGAIILDAGPVKLQSFTFPDDLRRFIAEFEDGRSGDIVLEGKDFRVVYHPGSASIRFTSRFYDFSGMVIEVEEVNLSKVVF